MNSATRAVVSFAVPAGVALAGAALALQVDAFPLSAKTLDFYSCAAFGLGALLAWRFRSSRMAVAVASLALAQRGLLAIGPGNVHLAWVAMCVVSVLLPANFIIVSLTQERGLRAASLMFWLVLMGVEAGAVAGVCGADDANFQALFTGKPVAWVHMPKFALAVFVVALGVLIARYCMRRRPVEAGLFWSLSAALLAFHAAGVTRAAAAYFATGGVVLLLALVESSYFMAFHDELTGLPARRAFNDAVLAIDGQFCVAVVDIDHFKRFNDTYGHETGDQVLRMVAAKLAGVTGGGKAYRVGGEEFNVLFRGVGLREALPHLDALRDMVEHSVFTIRGPDRPRRTPEDRRAAARQTGKEVAVTISIGAAQSSARLAGIDDVLRAADKALYQAKAAGRNRVEVYRGRGSRAAAPAQRESAFTR